MADREGTHRSFYKNLQEFLSHLFGKVGPRKPLSVAVPRTCGFVQGLDILHELLACFLLWHAVSMSYRSIQRLGLKGWVGLTTGDHGQKINMERLHKYLMILHVGSSGRILLP